MKNMAWCLLLLLCQYALSQTTMVKTDEVTDFTGNPYFYKDWSNGVVRFSGGRTMNQFKLKFDCLKNILLMQFDGSVFAADAKVHEFMLYPKNSQGKDSVLFRKDYPAVGQYSGNTFYQVLFQDKITLLRLPLRNVIEEKQVLTINGQQRRRIEEAEQYYLLHNGQLILLPDDRNGLLAVFGDQKDAIADFITARQLKMHSPEDYLLLAKKYDELLP